MKHFFLFFIIGCIFLEGCTSKSQNTMKYKDYKELHKNTGSTNYEVKTIFSEKFKISELLLDNIGKNLNVYGYTTPINKEDEIHHRRKFSSYGNLISEGPIYTILKDGTLWYPTEYNNWIIDDDTVSIKFKNPLSESEQNNPDKWLEKFKNLYNKSTFIHIRYKDYYFKINNEWYLVEAFKKSLELDLDIKKQFPPKIDESEKRMVELQDITPDFYIKKEKRDTTFMKSVGYEEFDSEKGKGINPINYSAGYHYIELYMPKGDTIKFKRFGSMGVNIETYKIPKEYGGHDDVIFIVQEPNELYPNNEFGGMYVIRPRELTEAEK